jgi:site-specific DNA-methyltransferase (adenine-specific)
VIDLYLGDCLDILPDAIPDESVNLAFVDPPYNIGIFCKMDPAEYLAWCEQWIALVSRKLTPNGAFWVSHKNPRILGQLADKIEAHGRGLINWITWDKYNGATPGEQYTMNRSKLGEESKRAFDVDAEYLIYHADEGQWTAQCDKERGFIFEPLRAYLDSEKERAGATTRQVAEAFQKKTGSRTVTGMAGHWFGHVQWSLPTEENYQWLRETLAHHNHGGEYLRREYEDLRREYEDLRREYEDLRYTFINPGKVSSVWPLPPAQANGHATPKPEALLERIIEITSSPGDVVLDPMMGSGTAGAVAIKYGRKFAGCELDPRYFEQARKRIEAMQNEMVQAELI